MDRKSQRKPERRFSVEGIRHQEPDLRRIARALIAYAQYHQHPEEDAGAAADGVALSTPTETVTGITDDGSGNERKAA